MAKFEEVLAPGLTIRESANDGSDFSNPTADYRRLFLGEDGLLHLKDSSGTVTDIGGSGAALVGDRYLDNSSHANYTTSSTTFAGIDAAMDLTIVTGAHHVLFGFGGMAGNSAGNTTAFDVELDGGRLGHATLGLTGTNNTTDALGYVGMTDALTAASHTFKWFWKVSTSSTATLFANTTGIAVHFWVAELAF